jgi:hypothetical protein
MAEVPRTELDEFTAELMEYDLVIDKVEAINNNMRYVEGEVVLDQSPDGDGITPTALLNALSAMAEFYYIEVFLLSVMPADIKVSWHESVSPASYTGAAVKGSN